MNAFVMVKCKCGMTVMCEYGEHKDGDLIEHSTCKLKGEDMKE